MFIAWIVIFFTGRHPEGLVGFPREQARLQVDDKPLFGIVDALRALARTPESGERA